MHRGSDGGLIEVDVGSSLSTALDQASYALLISPSQHLIIGVPPLVKQSDILPRLNADLLSRLAAGKWLSNEVTRARSRAVVELVGGAAGRPIAARRHAFIGQSSQLASPRPLKLSWAHFQ